MGIPVLSPAGDTSGKAPGYRVEGVGSGPTSRAIDQRLRRRLCRGSSLDASSRTFAGSRLCLPSVLLEAPLDCVPPKAGATVGAYCPHTGPGALPELIRYLLSDGCIDHQDGGTG